MYDVITIGAATRDVFLRSDNFKVAADKKLSSVGKVLYFNVGSKNELKEMILTTGGGATNTAVSFARHGFRTACVCRVGDEENGHDVVRDLAREGVSKELIQHDRKSPTAYSTILMTPKGERVILTKRGASDHIQFKDISLKKLKAKWLYVSSLAGDMVLLKKILLIARKKKIKVAYNPGIKELKTGLAKLGELLPLVNMFMVNQEEAAILTRIPFVNEKAIFKKLDSVVDGIVIMTKGPKGVVVSDGMRRFTAGIPRSKVYSRTGAGDAFGAGFISGLLIKDNIPFAIQRGTANSTSVIQHFSAKTGLLYKGQWGVWPRMKVTIKNIREIQS